MFTTVNYYIIVTDNSFVMKKDGDTSENIIAFQSYIPNIPFYYHLFDKDKNYITEITKQVKSLRMKKVTIVLPDDAIDIQVDKQILTEFFMQCGTKIVKINFQCFLLNLEKENYITISKTVRNLVLQYISNKKSLTTKYYDKEYTDVLQISSDIKKFHNDYGYGEIPVYINNINNNMDRFKSLGDMVSINDAFANIMNYK